MFGEGYSHLDLGLGGEVSIGELFTLWLRISKGESEAIASETDHAESTR